MNTAGSRISFHRALVSRRRQSREVSACASAGCRRQPLKEVCVKLRPTAVLTLGFLLFASQAFSQSDPGIRGGPPGAGGPLPSVAADNPLSILKFFNDGKARF